MIASRICSGGMKQIHPPRGTRRAVGARRKHQSVEMASNIASIGKEFLRASQKGDVNLVKELTSKYCVSNWTKYRHEVSGDTALHLAAREGHLEVTKFLCEWWTEPSFRTEVANKDMKRPLHEAGQFARSDVLEYLIGKDQRLHFYVSGNGNGNVCVHCRPSLRLARKAHAMLTSPIKVSDHLAIDVDAEIDALKRADWTPLMLACTKRGPKATRCVELLLNHGASSYLRNKDGWTPLLIACRAGNIETVQMLVKNSPCCIDARSKNGRSPLHVAAFHGHSEVIDLLLLEDSSLVDGKDSSGSTPLLESIKSGDLKTVKTLIKCGANIQVVDTMGQNILHYAAQAGDTEIIKFILNNRLVDIDARASFDITPLMLAEKNKRLEAIEILTSFFNHNV